MVRIRILVSLLAICTGGVFGSDTCQSETLAEEVTLLQGRHAVKKHAQPEEAFEEEWLNEEMPAELPPVPDGYIERVGDWVAENPSATAVFRKAIREQLLHITQLSGNDEFREFTATIPRAASAMIWWSERNEEQAERLAEIVAELSHVGDWGGAALHEWAASNPGFAAALRGVTRERLLQIIFEAARTSETEEVDDRTVFPLATTGIRMWTRHNPYKAQEIFDLIRGVEIEESLLEREANEDAVGGQGTEGASTPLDFDSEEGPPTLQQEVAVNEDMDLPSQELTAVCSAHRRTRGTCFFRDCYDWRGVTQCVRGRCECAEGQCSASSPSLGRRGFCTNPFEWQRLQMN